MMRPRAVLRSVLGTLFVLPLGAAGLARAQSAPSAPAATSPAPAAAPRPQPGLAFPVSINTNPPHANIYVDNRELGIQGQTGPDSSIRMPRGRRKILLELDGYQPLEVVLDLWQPQRLSFQLKPLPGRVEVRTLSAEHPAQGAEVYVDGRVLGVVPCSIEVTAGRHVVEVRRDGAVLHAEPLEVGRGETHPVYVPQPSGSLQVTASAPADVIVDDKPRGPAPLLVGELAPGEHTVQLIPHDRSLAPLRRTVSLRAGEQVRLDEPLVAAAPVTPTAANPPPGMVYTALVAYRPEVRYLITTGSGQTCQTPCGLHLMPGTTHLGVFGPDKLQFEKSITIPPFPAQITVRHRSLVRIVLGSILTGLSVPAVVIGTIAIAGRAEELGLVLTANGVLLLGAGIGLLAAYQPNSAVLTPLPVPGARSAVRLSGFGVAAAPGPSGALASVRLTF